MSSLDDKLREILDSFTDRPLPKNPFYRKGQNDIMAQIKQAFADEGYAPTINYKDLDESEKAEVTRRVFDQNYMTGQEWYARFEKELYKPKPQVYPRNANDDGESHDRFFRDGGTNFMYRKALEAARRAAGLDPDS